MLTSLMLTLLMGRAALATIDEQCDGLVKPDNYDDQVQGDFLANYAALSTSLSPIHGPIPHKAGRGAIGLDIAVIPPLGCGSRFVEDWTKTEDTNKAPAVPRPRATFAFKPIAQLVYPYAGVAVVPPIFIGNKVEGTQTMIASGEIGAGIYLPANLTLSLRAHATMQRTLGNIAAAYEEGDKEYYDLYVGSTTGIDLTAGMDVVSSEKTQVTPYLAFGLLEATDFFWIGDDGYVGNNLHPYFGPAFSVGVDTLLKDRLRLAGEFYGAPGGHSKPLESVTDVEEGAFSRYGHIYTARLRVAYEL